MGGDFAPRNVVAGAVEALNASGGRIEIIFAGPRNVVEDELASSGGSGLRLKVVDAPEVIDMHDGATAALKQKKQSSISVGMNLHKEGQADAFVSAGHSGAVMSAATLILGRIEGISRPTIGAFFPSERGVCLLVDAGANVDCKPQQLYEFAVMGSIYTREMFGVPNPAVGLLSIGEEPTKGNEVVKDTHKLLKESALNFIGNVEGRDVLQGKAQVVVCDGFVGNILLKFGESVPGFLKAMLREAVRRSVLRKLMALAARGTLRSALKGLDYEEHGGVPVLGVNGVAIIGHGKSTPKAIKNMILRAEEMVRKNINARIAQALATS